MQYHVIHLCCGEAILGEGEPNHSYFVLILLGFSVHLTLLDSLSIVFQPMSLES